MSVEIRRLPRPASNSKFKKILSLNLDYRRINSAKSKLGKYVKKHMIRNTRIILGRWPMDFTMFGIVERRYMERRIRRLRKLTDRIK